MKIVHKVLSVAILAAEKAEVGVACGCFAVSEVAVARKGYSVCGKKGCKIGISADVFAHSVRELDHCAYRGGVLRLVYLVGYGGGAVRRGE